MVHKTNNFFPNGAPYYSVSRRKQIDELLYHTSLGDRRPTEMLAHMRELVGTHDSPDLLEKLFLDRLPRDV